MFLFLRFYSLIYDLFLLCVFIDLFSAFWFGPILSACFFCLCFVFLVVFCCLSIFLLLFPVFYHSFLFSPIPASIYLFYTPLSIYFSILCSEQLPVIILICVQNNYQLLIYYLFGTITVTVKILSLVQHISPCYFPLQNVTVKCNVMFLISTLL